MFLHLFIALSTFHRVRMKCGNLADTNSWKNRREHRQKRERERKWKRERKSYSERIVLQKRRSRAATSSQPLIRTTASSEHNGQRRCLSAFEQTKRNRGTKQKRVGVAVKWNSEWKRKKANWRETERERERKRERERERVLFRKLSCMREGSHRKRGCSFTKRGSFPLPSSMHKRPRVARRRRSPRYVP